MNSKPKKATPLPTSQPAQVDLISFLNSDNNSLNLLVDLVRQLISTKTDNTIISPKNIIDTLVETINSKKQCPTSTLNN